MAVPPLPPRFTVPASGDRRRARRPLIARSLDAKETASMRDRPLMGILLTVLSLMAVPVHAEDIAGEVSGDTVQISNIDEFKFVRGSVNRENPLRSEAFIRMRGRATGNICPYSQFVVERRYGASVVSYPYPHTEIVLHPYSPAPLYFWTGVCQASLETYPFDAVIKVTPGTWSKDKVEVAMPYVIHTSAAKPLVFVIRLHLSEGWSVRPFEEASNKALERTGRRLASYGRAVRSPGRSTPGR